MKNLIKYSIVLVVLLIIFSCKQKPYIKPAQTKIIKGEGFELRIAAKQEALLILLPCFPCDIAHIKNEANFIENIEDKGVSTFLLGYNNMLYLDEETEKSMVQEIDSVLNSNQVKIKNIHIGGFSSGGNLALMLSNYLLKTNNRLKPKGVFAIDSPVDLERLYLNSLDNITKNFNKDSTDESKFLVNMLEAEIGNPKKNIDNYCKLSPFVASAECTNNIAYLKDIKVRFYTEPDLEWHLKNRNQKYEDLNAYQLDKAQEALKKLGGKKIEFIVTKNRGIRANGEKHPHSWNLVDQKDLIEWIKK